MKAASTGTASGCVVLVLVFTVLMMCVCPVTAVAGSLTSNADPVVGLVGPWLCPKGTTAQIHTFDTTTTDDNGNTIPATGSEMNCVDASGNVVSNPGPTYAFLWTGILIGVGIVLAAILSLLLAVPAGAAIARWSARRSAPPAASGLA